MTTSGATKDNEWYNEWQRMTTNNEWQQMTMSDCEWQGVVYKEWQRMTMNDRERQKVVQRVKAAHLLQKMDDYNSFYNENRCTASRMHGWY